MAILSLPPATATTSTYPPPESFPKFNAKNFRSLPPLPLPINHNHPFLPLRSHPNTRLRLFHAKVSPQPPTQPDPPPERDPVKPEGIAANFSGFQDRVRIFLAVFFWLSLFFWASAWDRTNGGSGRSSKGSRFRR